MTGQSPDQSATPAVVVGLCSHGLATVDALADCGVDVHAVEADRRTPGIRTRRAAVHPVEDVNGPGLIQALKKVRAEVDFESAPVLYLMNDNMVRQISEGWDELDELYRLSWSRDRDTVRGLLVKSGLQSHCERIGVPYPRSSVLREGHDLGAGCSDLKYPIVVKPVKPLSGFKAKRLQSRVGLEDVLREHEGDLPFLVQEWIPGDDRRLFFCAFYLVAGEIVATFVGQKLRSRPPALGGTTTAVPHYNADVEDLARRFFEPLNLSGPVSLEVKIGPNGQPRVIEPTVGRTDFWLKCCVRNGVNLPFVEYCHMTNRRLAEIRPVTRVVWMDTESDPLALPWYFLSIHGWVSLRARVTFPYFRWRDLGPFFAACRKTGGVFLHRLWRKLFRLMNN